MQIGLDSTRRQNDKRTDTDHARVHGSSSQ